jgi:ferredoxin
LGTLRCGACHASVDFVAEMVKPPRTALLDDEVAR